MKRPALCFFGVDSVPDNLISDQDLLTIMVYKTDNDLNKIIYTKQPDVLISIGNTWTQFKNLANADLIIKRKWLHYRDLSQVLLNHVYFCFLNNLKESSEQVFTK